MVREMDHSMDHNKSNCNQLSVASYSYNKTRANAHATVIKLSLGHFCTVCDFKKQPNDNLIHNIHSVYA